MKKIGKRFENTVADSVAEPIRAGDLKVARGPGVTRRSLVAAFASAVMALALLAGCGGALRAMREAILPPRRKRIPWPARPAR